MPSTPPRPPSGRPRPATRAQRAEATRFRRALTLVTLSVVAPGSAQYIAGHRRTGVIALRTWGGLILAAGLVIWLVPMEHLAGLAARPWLLIVFKILAFTIAVAWAALILDAWRLAYPPSLTRKHRLVLMGTTVGVVVAVASPLVVAARYATAAHDAVVEMFPSGEVAAASDGRLNILLLGGDAGDGRVGLRPDSIHLVSVDVETGEPALISLPRNLERARFAEGTPAAEEFPDGFTGEGDPADYLLNATWTYGEENPELFPGEDGPGATAVQQAVSGTLGVPIHYYVVIDLTGFRDLVDALGGITVRVNEELPIGEKGKTLEPGLQHLDGYHALWYARSREGSSDYARMARQRCVLGAFLREADPQTVLTNFVDLVDASKSVVTTDIPRQDLANLIDLALEAKTHEVRSLQFVPPLITPGDPDFGLIAERTDELLSGVPVDEETAEPTEAADDEPAEEPADEGTPKADDDSADDSADEPTDDEPADEETPDASEPVEISDVCSYE